MKLPEHIYHLAEASNWISIQRDGLISAGRLQSADGLAGADRNRLDDNRIFGWATNQSSGRLSAALDSHLMRKER